MSSSERRRSQRQTMDGMHIRAGRIANVTVKVLYTLDTSPHTMIARAGHRVSVRIARKQGTNVLLGRVLLKTCLNAICLASPELLLDKNRDYIVYAVDPEESDASHASVASPQKYAPVFVGKGFFSGGIAEPGDGTSFVTGQVRLESRTSSAFSSDEEETPAKSTQFLEIVLRMKEASHLGREQYQSRLRGLAAPPVPAPSTPVLSEPSIPPKPASTPSAQVLQVLQAMQAHKGGLSQDQQSHLMGLLDMVAGAVQCGALPTSAGAEMPRPPSNTRTEPKAAPRASRPGLRDTRAEMPRICYNCGTTNATTWRILTLPSGVTINHPASERPPSDAVPLTWTPQYPNSGPIQTHSEARWQACNPCGLYFAKYGVARPEYVRNFVARPSKDDKKRESTSQATGRSMDRIKRERSQTSPGSTRVGFSRTLSTVANRDAERLQKRQRQHMHDENLPPTSPDAAMPVSYPTVKSPAHSASMRHALQASPSSSAFGIPSSLMNSSPSTMLNTLMSAPGLPPTPRRTRPEPASSPVRRSPRKQPPGTMADVNPYASAAQRSASSPAPKRAAGTARDALTSPADRSHVLPTLNPFMGLSTLDDDMDPLGCPPSPTEGRTSRAKPAPKRDIRTPSRMPRDQTWPTSPTLALSEPFRIHEPIKDLFPDNAQGHWMADWGSGSTHALSPHHAATEQPAPDAAVHDKTETSLVTHAPRRPMPTTVEDASSSQSGSPPATSPDMDDSLVDLIEDPYGLLSACGLGMMQQPNQGTQGIVMNPSGVGGFSADAFNQIEIHNSPSFTQQLDAFTQSGHLGIAAHMNEPQGVSVLPAAEVRSFGHANKSAPTALESFLDDPTVQSMLNNLNESTAPIKQGKRELSTG